MFVFFYTHFREAHPYQFLPYKVIIEIDSHQIARINIDI